MAKQLVNPFQRHIEKAALGVAVLVLLAVAAYYGVRSPNRIDVGGQIVTPGDIDQRIREQAMAVRNRIRNAPVDVEDVEPLYGEFEAQLDPFKKEGLTEALPLAAPFHPPVPVVDPPEGGFGGVQLAEVVPLQSDPPPKAVSGRSTFIVSTEQGERYVVANWVMVSALFNVKAQRAELRKKYGAFRTDVVFGPVELQRRMQGADGTWPETWETVEPWYPSGRPPIPPPPKIQLVKDEEGVITLSVASAAELDQYERFIREGQRQLDLIRPLPPEIRNGTPWTMPILTSRRDVLVQDDYHLYPNDPPNPDPEDRYPDAVEEEQVAETLTKEEEIAQKLKQAEQLLQSAERNKNRNDATRAWNLGEEVEHDPAATPADQNRARQIKARATLLEQRIAREELMGTKAPKTSTGPQEGERPQREPPPMEQIWAYDMAPDSVRSGRIYQYRMRVSILNALAGEPEKLQNPLDARKVFLTGPWSDPVEVAVPEDFLFFITSEDPRSGEVALEFYRWFEGAWVKTPRRVKLGVGDRMRDTQLTVVPSILDPTTSARDEVEYDARATILDIDFDRPYRPRRRGKERDGVVFGNLDRGTAVVFIDEEGRLHERFVQTDKVNPERKQKSEELYTPPESQ